MKINQKKLVKFILFLLAAAGAVIMIFPFVWMVSNALKRERLCDRISP